MQVILESPQCTLEPFGSQVLGAQAQAGTVHPQLNLDDAVQGGVHRTVQAVSFSKRHHTLHGLLAQDVRKGTVGQGGGEVLQGP